MPKTRITVRVPKGMSWEVGEFAAGVEVWIKDFWDEMLGHRAEIAEIYSAVDGHVRSCPECAKARSTPAVVRHLASLAAVTTPMAPTLVEGEQDELSARLDRVSTSLQELRAAIREITVTVGEIAIARGADR